MAGRKELLSRLLASQGREGEGNSKICCSERMIEAGCAKSGILTGSSDAQIKNLLRSLEREFNGHVSIATEAPTYW